MFFLCIYSLFVYFRTNYNTNNGGARSRRDSIDKLSVAGRYGDAGGSSGHSRQSSGGVYSADGNWQDDRGASNPQRWNGYAHPADETVEYYPSGAPEIVDGRGTVGRSKPNGGKGGYIKYSSAQSMGKY